MNRTSITANNLLSNDKAAVTVSWSENGCVTAQMHGKATFITDQAELNIAKDLFYTAYPHVRNYENDPDLIFMVFALVWTRFSNANLNPALKPFFRVRDECQPHGVK